MKKKTQHIARLIKNCVNDIDPSATVLLYGSRARGDEHQDSDWDILILTDYPANLEVERKFRNDLYDLELETEESFSIFVYSKHDWKTKQKITPYYQNVITEGISL